jgi:hypothetical protein
MEVSMMKTKKLLSTLALSMFSTATFVATPLQAGDTEAEQLFYELDTDENKKVSIAEAEDNTRVLKQFEKLDKNKNNELEESEFMAFEPVEQFTPPDPEDPEPGAAPLE